MTAKPFCSFAINQRDRCTNPEMLFALFIRGCDYDVFPTSFKQVYDSHRDRFHKRFDAAFCNQQALNARTGSEEQTCFALVAGDMEDL